MSRRQACEQTTKFIEQLIECVCKIMKKEKKKEIYSWETKKQNFSGTK